MRKLLGLIFLSLCLFLVWHWSYASESCSKEQTKCEQAIEILHSIKKYEYVWGGESVKEGGFDCSGMLHYIHRMINRPIPRTTAKKMWILAEGEKKHWEKGQCLDWTWFTLQPQRPYGHIGLHTKENNFWQSGSSTGPSPEVFWKGNFWDEHHVGTKDPKVE